MTSSNNINHQSAGNRWFAHIFLILFFQSVFFGSIFIVLYALVTLNWKLGLFLISVSLLQRRARRSGLFIDIIKKYVKPLNYFKSFQRIYQEPISKNQCAMFCLHPHSVLSYCIPSNMNADDSKMSEMTGLASRFLLALPFVGLQLRLWGIQSVNHKNIRRLMKQKKPIGLTPGGFEQATLTTPKQLRVYIKDRKGFIKYALQHNYTIYPVLTYNEHKAFWTFDYFNKIRLFINKLKIPAVLFGMGFLWLYLPLELQIVNIVGKGIRRRTENAQKDIRHQEINEIHSQYIEELKRMHQKYRQKYGEAPLVIY